MRRWSVPSAACAAVRRRRHLLAALAVVLGAGTASLATASPALAHSSLIATTPAAGSITQTAPRAIRFQFSEVVEVTSDAAHVVGPDGQSLAVQPVRDPASADSMVVALPGHLPVGTYTVDWGVVSVDGHPVSGEFRFANRRVTSPLDAASSNAAGGPTVLGAIGRAGSAAGALAVLGIVTFPLFVVGPVRRRLGGGDELAAACARRLRRPLALSGVVGVVGTLIVVVDTVAAADGLTAASAMARPGAMAAFLTGSHTGRLLLVRIACLAVALMALCAGTARRQAGQRRLIAGTVASLGALLTLSLSSHAAGALADRPLAVAFDATHLVASGVWLGGLLALALAGLPAAREVGRRDRMKVGEAAGALSSSFSVVAQLAMLGVLTTGGYAALMQVSALRQLGDTAWGMELTVKVALWVTVLMFAAANAVTFVPQVAGRAAAAGLRLAAADRLRSAINLELAMAAGLIAVAVVMSATAPPTAAGRTRLEPSAAGPSRTTAAHGRAQGFTADVRVVRSGIGSTRATVFQVSLTTENTPASAPRADALLAGPDGVDRAMRLLFAGQGRWTTDRLAVPPGSYRLTARFDRLGRPVDIPVKVRVPS